MNQEQWKKLREGTTTFLFDMDGLLLDTEKLYTRCWRQASADCGVEMSVEQSCEMRSLDSGLARKYFEKCFGTPDCYDRIRARRKVVMAEVVAREGIDQKPGAAALLGELEERGIAFAVVTASERERALGYLAQGGIVVDPSHVVSTSQVRRGKPYPDVYLLACEKMGIRPGEAIAFEDAPNGVLSAHAAGCRVINVPDLTEPDERVLGAADGVAGSLTEVLELLRGE